MEKYEDWYNRMESLGRSIDDLGCVTIAQNKDLQMDVILWRDYRTRKVCFGLNSNSNINRSSVQLFLPLNKIYKICRIIEED